MTQTRTIRTDDEAIERARQAYKTAVGGQRGISKAAVVAIIEAMAVYTPALHVEVL